MKKECYGEGGKKGKCYNQRKEKYRERGREEKRREVRGRRRSVGGGEAKKKQRGDVTEKDKK